MTVTLISVRSVTVILTCYVCACPGGVEKLIQCMIPCVRVLPLVACIGVPDGGILSGQSAAM